MGKNKLKLLYQLMGEMSVLYVEDNPDSAEQMMDYLSELFGTAYHAQNGQEGLDIFKNHKIDIIVTDIIMPKMTGFQMLSKIDKIRKDVPTFIISAHNYNEYYEETLSFNVKGFLPKPFSLNKLIELFLQVVKEINTEKKRIEKLDYLNGINNQLNDIGQNIATEKDSNVVLETILKGAIDLSKADGGTLYLYNKNTDALDFKIAINKSLNINHNSFNENSDLNLKSLKLHNDDKSINRRNISVISAYEKKLLNLENIYEQDHINLDGIKEFDKTHNYKTSSMLVIPLINIEDELFGVIQLVNKIDNGKRVSFKDEDQLLLYSFSSIATMTIYNNKLLFEFENLVNSLVKSIGSALNEKSCYTAKHVDNVAELAEILAIGVNKNISLFPDVIFDSNQLAEIRLAAWLHDIGKITTPEHIIHKKTRLESVNDRIDLVLTRLEVYKRDIKILFYENEINANERKERIEEIENDISFLTKINQGYSTVSADDKKRIQQISSKAKVVIHNKEIELLSSDEVYNLSIDNGTLNQEEKEIINNHVVVSYNMLKEITFPTKYKDVAKIAGSHHKTLDNKGYCHKDIQDLDMTIQDNILAVADIFEALSAKDRPYKKPFSLNEIAHKLKEMAEENIVDENIVQLFFEEKLYEDYVNRHFTDEQKDIISIKFEKDVSE